MLFLGAISQGQEGVATPTVPADAPATWQEIHLIESLLPQLADPAAGRFQLAHDYAHLAQSERAMALLEQSMAADEGFDPESDDDFSSLRSERAFQKLVDRVHRRYPPVHQAAVAFTTSENDLVPEGLASDPRGDTLYLGSLNRRKIVRIERNGSISDVFPAGEYAIGALCGLKVEGQSDSIWVAACAGGARRSELLHFNLEGKLLERFFPPGGGEHLLNDLVLRGLDEIYVTDSLANRVYRFDRTAHTFSEVVLCRPVYYPNGIALSGDGRLLYIADAFGILQVVPSEGSCREINPGRANTVSGVDGLYWHNGDLIAVQNGLGEPRVARFKLSHDGLTVTATTVLEYRSPSVELPTTGAILGSKFYFISNAQIGNFRDGKVVDPAKLQPVRISAIDLKD